MIQDYQKEFLELCINQQVLKFGQFQLKSGRISPFFFNAGLLYSGQAVGLLGRWYARVLKDHFIGSKESTADCVIFGPAYKGIPLCTAVSVQLVAEYGLNLDMAYSRKEKKDHGEGGQLVGAPLQNKQVFIVDDVITAGTAIRETAALIDAVPGAKLAGVVVALDRQEKGGASELSAIQEIERDYGCPVKAIVTLDNLLEYLESLPAGNPYAEHIPRIREYRQKYGV